MLKLIRIHATVPMENIYAEVGPKIHHSGTEISASPIIFFAPPNIALPIHRGVIVTWHLMIYTHEAFTSESQDLSCGEMDL
jgi:hypothetical protein